METNRENRPEQNSDALLDDEFDVEKPSHGLHTLKRLMHTAKDQRLRLIVVLISVALDVYKRQVHSI